jgi:excisionase family DNA binding protein
MATKQTYTTTEAAEILEMSPSSLRRLVNLKVIHCQYTHGRHYRFTLDNLLEYKARQNA